TDYSCACPHLPPVSFPYTQPSFLYFLTFHPLRMRRSRPKILINEPAVFLKCRHSGEPFLQHIPYALVVPRQGRFALHAEPRPERVPLLRVIPVDIAHIGKLVRKPDHLYFHRSIFQPADCRAFALLPRL